MATDAAVLQAIQRHTTQQAIVRRRVLDYVGRQWRGMESWRDADIDAFVSRVVPVVEAGQVQIAAITDSYLAAVETQVRGAVQPVGVPADIVNDLAMRGVETAEVYGRSGPAVWTELSNGVPLSTAVDLALNRLLATAATDMQLAHTHASRHVLSTKPYVVGHRRVLTGSKSCRLCVTASTQRYRSDELSPIHARCDCKVLPIYDTQDPGRTINSELLSELKRQGISGDLSLSQTVARKRRSINLADERLAELAAELKSETDNARSQRLETRVDEWRDRKRKYEAELQRSQDQLDDFRGRNGRPKTVVVHDHGEIGRILADADHRFTSLADLGRS